jgi:predicted DNA-binding transcriptional regulator AlpA
MSKQAATARPELRSVEDIASTLGISAQTLMRMVRAGRFPKPIRLGQRCLRWSASAVDRHLASLEHVNAG